MRVPSQFEATRWNNILVASGERRKWIDRLAAAKKLVKREPTVDARPAPPYSDVQRKADARTMRIIRTEAALSDTSGWVWSSEHNRPVFRPSVK